MATQIFNFMEYIHALHLSHRSLLLFHGSLFYLFSLSLSFFTPLVSSSKRDIAAANFIMHEVHCRRNITLCRDCQEPVPRSEMEAHFEEYHKPVGCVPVQGRIQDFHLVGGGAQKIMWAHAHHKLEARSPLTPGSRAHKWALEALGVFDALSCYLSLIFKHSDTKWDKKNTVDQFFFFFFFFWGGGAPLVLPSKSATAV